MNRIIFTAALVLGTLAVAWISAIIGDTNILALTVTLIIGGVYGIGVVELIQFRRATSTLTAALDGINGKVAALDEWLYPIHGSLHNSVRLRIEGERVGLPAPILTPYLTGLLVMLGLLGTFVGMVYTLRGAVGALEGSTEILAIRDALAAPIKGLGLAFGTSVAGVAASAMLGLMSTFSRRDRILASRRLDTVIPKDFQGYSLAHQQRETFKALQEQSRALPQVADRMAVMADKLDRLGDRLAANQDRFHSAAKEAYADFAASVDKTHKENLRESIRLAGEGVKPILQETLAGIAAETRQVHQELRASGTETLAEMSKQLTAMSKDVAQSGQAGLAAQAVSNEKLIRHLKDSLEVFKGQFAHMVEAMSEQWRGIGEKTLSQQQRMAGTLEETVRELTADTREMTTRMHKEVSDLIQTATEAPRAATEVIEQLRREAADTAERENGLLAEHRGILAEIDALSRTLAESANRQNEAVVQLVDTSKEMMADIARRFSDQVNGEVSNLSKITEGFAVSAVEMASLGEAFGAAVDAFNTSNSNLIENLARIEETLDTAASRSDAQLGYYVAQAREIIDQCMVSQKEIFEELQQLRPKKDIDLEAGEWKN